MIRGWWSIDTSHKPTQADLEHIASLVKEGFIAGHMIEEED